MKNINNKRIATVIPPLTLMMSALARVRKLNPYEEWLSQYADPIVFSKYRTQWLEGFRLYTRPDGILWLFLRLPYKLIKGKYSLFEAHARDPQGIITFAISKLLRKPLILSDTFYIWSESSARESIPSKMQWPLSRFIFSRATILCVSSSRVMNFWKSAGIPAKTRLCSNFMSVIEMNEKNVAKAVEIKKKLEYQKIVLFVGRLIERKGLEYLIRAFARFSEYNDIGLLIVGDGPERNRLEALCKELKTHVIFIWRTDERKEIAPYFLLSDIFVFPTITLKLHEEWGLVVNEAMSVAKPVIVSNSAGCAHELVKNGVNGYIVQEKNVEALYEAIRRLLTNDELRMRMGKESKRIIDSGFTYAHAIENTRKLLLDAFAHENS